VPRNEQPIEELAFTVVDVETTGLEPEDRITEVAALRLEELNEVGRFHSLVNPGIHIPPTASAISGIDDAMVSTAPAFPAVWPRLEHLLDDAVFVAHNAPFDLHFLSAERKRAGLEAWKGPVIDTLRLARNTYTLPGYSLKALHRSLELEDPPAHRALADAITTAGLLRRLLARWRERARTLGELLAAQEPIPVPWENLRETTLTLEATDRLSAAGRSGAAVEIDYEGRNGMQTFRLVPVRLERNGPLYYLRGRLLDRGGDPGVFRMDRIRQVRAAEA
jgi:DNA polymerase III epsilon subunit family exonuclease